MDKKTLLLLFYTTAVLPISYTIGQWFLPSRGWLGFGLMNTISLILFSLLFSTTPSTSNSKKKNIVLILLALFVGTTLFSGLIDDMLVDSSLWFHTKLRSSRVDITDTISSGNQTSTGSEETLLIPKITSGTSTSIQTGTTKVLLESDDDNNILSTDKTSGVVSTSKEDSLTTSVYTEGTYGKVIPYLVSTYKLKDIDKANPAFQFVSANSSLYNSFAIAYANSMIGKEVKPTTKISCDTYLVLKGIAAKRKVSYTGSPFVAYRAEAEKKGVVNGCDAKEYVTNKTL